MIRVQRKEIAMKKINSHVGYAVNTSSIREMQRNRRKITIYEILDSSFQAKLGL
jgi:hypothetical protein